MSNLLFDEMPLVVSVPLAKEIGLNEAILLQQLHYWVQKNTNIIDGKSWAYNTLKQWGEQFPFWSESTLRRIFEKLTADGIIVKGNYNKKAFDRTLWYAIDYDALDEKIARRLPEMTNASVQNEHMDMSKMNTPIPEITTEITNINKESSNSNYCSMTNAQSSPPSTLTATLPLQQVVEIYKQFSPTLYGKEFDKGLNDDYKNAQALFAAVDEGFTISDAEQLFSKAESSAWLTTEAKNITFEWLIKKRKLVLNGKYDNSEPKEKTDIKQEKYGVTRRLW